MFGIKIKPLKWIGKAVQVAAPVALSVVGGPVAGAIAVATSGGTAGVKKCGKAVEEMTGLRLHKVAAPVVVMGLPAVAVAALSAFGVDAGGLGKVTEMLAALGLEGVPPWAVVGLSLWLSHQVGNNIESSGRRESSG